LLKEKIKQIERSVKSNILGNDLLKKTAAAKSSAKTKKESDDNECEDKQFKMLKRNS